MHQTRTQVSKKVPIPRKGTKYIARQSSHLEDSISVVNAVRDMLNLARTAKEVKEMIKQKLLKINGREVKDYRESILLFNIFTADKSYLLSLTDNGKFKLEETKEKNRPCKVINKKMLKGKNIQLNLHDGTNLISKEKVNVGDTVYLANDKKITKIVSLDKGVYCIITSGKYLGANAKITKLDGREVTLEIKSKDKSTILDKKEIFVL